MLTLVSLLFDGIAYGMLLFLISAGLTITLGVMRVINLSHSAFAMVGGYLTLAAMRGAGVPFAAAVGLGVAGTMLLGAVLERTLYRWIYTTPPLGQLLMTIGLAFIITAVVKNLAGPSLQTLQVPASLQGNWTVGELNLSVYRSALIAVSGVAALGLWWGLEKTLYGARLRAAVDDAPMARCVGINVGRVFSITFAVGCGMAALGGALGSPLLPLEPYYGLKYLVLVLIVVAVGGLGSLRGSLVAALVLGTIDTVGRYYVPSLGAFLIYLVVLALLLWRPDGLVPRSA